ncbi:MAG: 3-oxoacyl-ACP reductase family protein [Desulfobaccales bacterium]|jgi:3-oxoacyl-[acyl-carrier protein] reductase
MGMLDDFTGKVALVTGASRGIGQAVAFALAEAGADIAVNYRHREAQALETVRGIERLGRRAVPVRADVSLATEVADMVAVIEADLGQVDILVNNAGIVSAKPLPEISEADWDEMLAVNLKSAFLVIQRVLPGMRARRWGRIINLSSVAAQTGGVTGPHYAASKAGLLGLTHSYARQLVKEGITVNAIAPALIETEMVTGNLNVTPLMIPVGRFGTPDEVAAVVVLLARDGYITGQTINVNGGWYMS